MSNTEDGFSAEAAATPTDSTPALHLGKELRAAREAKGLDRQDVALQLRLDIGIIEALENDDLERLPAMTFVRGYLRSYARLMGMDESRVKEALPESSPLPRPTQGKRRTYRRSPLAPRFPWGRWIGRSLVLGLLVFLGVVLFPKGMELWNARQGTPATEDAQTQLALPELGGSSPASPLPPATESSALALPVPVPAPAPMEPAVEDLEMQAISDMAVDQNIPVEARVTTPSHVPDAGPVKQVLVLQFEEDSWVELSDNRERLLYGLMRANTSKTIAGQPPFSVKLGNARGVRLQYEGEPYDLGSHTRGNVARFRLP